MTAASARAQDWAVPVVRGALALAATAAITFSQDHSPAMGLLVFGIWAVVAGVVVGALSLRFVADRTTRTVTLVSAIVTAVAGLLALTLPAGLPFFLTLVSAWAAITGFLELYLGLRGRGKDAGARDRLAAGVFTAVLAVLFVLLPPDSVTAVGFFGAYLAILGVYLVIGGLSQKWAAAPGRGESPAAGAATPGTEQS
ncbi:hypothetical protein [Agromyces sp. NBRC 114283]|uniref:hypothetical protein n=1 Tax=Agromyces sp. NBRC 114283 TaxID=2994521 RepID=UPI0024A1A2BD|nr:hypothetical protein [Agromyces sp. NBRC 114283]GLU88137.1 hypothetical protein Agsp01_03920 [Agromyces sp. NBRC 114283]